MFFSEVHEKLVSRSLSDAGVNRINYKKAGFTEFCESEQFHVFMLSQAGILR